MCKWSGSRNDESGLESCLTDVTVCSGRGILQKVDRRENTEKVPITNDYSPKCLLAFLIDVHKKGVICAEVADKTMFLHKKGVFCAEILNIVSPTRVASEQSQPHQTSYC